MYFFVPLRICISLPSVPSVWTLQCTEIRLVQPVTTRIKDIYLDRSLLFVRCFWICFPSLFSSCGQHNMSMCLALGHIQETAIALFRREVREQKVLILNNVDVLWSSEHTKSYSDSLHSSFHTHALSRIKYKYLWVCGIPKEIRFNN